MTKIRQENAISTTKIQFNKILKQDSEGLAFFFEYHKKSNDKKLNS